MLAPPVPALNVTGPVIDIVAACAQICARSPAVNAAAA